MSAPQPKILLDPVDFMALHLSSLANNGIGGWRSWRGGEPWCVRGHAQWLEGYDGGEETWGPSMPMADRIGPNNGGLPQAGDRITAKLGIAFKMTFEEYVAQTNLDIQTEEQN